jgi:hypothetical protein
VSNFQAQFNATLEQNITAVNSIFADLQSLLPGLHSAHIRRLLNNVSSLLGKVDRQQVAHPEFLAGSPTNIPQRAVELASGIPSSVAAGAGNFLQATLPALVEVERELISAVGVGEYKIQDIKNAQVRSLNQIIDRAQQTQNEINTKSARLDTYLKTTTQLVTDLGERAKSASGDATKIGELRKLAERLAKGNASQNPLEAVVRVAREKLGEIEDAVTKSQQSEKTASGSLQKSVDAETEIQKLLERLSATEVKARSILSTATQAGLAGAYKLEREKLEKQQKWFAYGFYGIIASIILYAAIFIIPLISRVFEAIGKGSITGAESAFMLAVRIVVIAPAFWALIFTSRRYTNLETLQMDYAAKATTALAYFGYKDEMDEDPSLAAKLKDGLIARFIEHPSRLLGKKVESSSSVVGPDGTKVMSETHSPGIEGTLKINPAEILSDY